MKVHATSESGHPRTEGFAAVEVISLAYPRLPPNLVDDVAVCLTHASTRFEHLDRRLDLHERFLRAEADLFKADRIDYIVYGDDLVHNPDGSVEQNSEIITASTDEDHQVGEGLARRSLALKRVRLSAENTASGKSHTARPPRNVVAAARRLIQFQQTELRREIELADAIMEQPRLSVLEAIELTNLEAVAFLALWSKRRGNQRGRDVRAELCDTPLTVCRRCGLISGQRRRHGNYCDKHSEHPMADWRWTV